MSGNGALLFWLAPLLPLAVFALLAIGLARFGRVAAGLAIAAMAGALLVSALGLLDASQGKSATVALPWLTIGGSYRLTLALWLDPLSAVAAALVSLVGLIVFIYAASYMAEDRHRGRFFAEFSLFTASMLALVLAADIMTLYIAWELVGLCSYLLIGFWFERPGVPAAASKAFFITRLADLALLAGVLLLIGTVGSGRLDTILPATTHAAPSLLLIIAFLLFAGAAGKSAQFPFQGWLPDAMLGPTPVSALLHSATMVAAGVFLVARLYPLFLAAGPVILSAVAWVGVTTALLGGAAALVERDVKRALAYSTMSQIGLMFVGLGSGSLLAGVLLLLAQALYKATLFLGAGAIDHAVGGTVFERMGGLAKRMPLTALAFAIGAAALAGLPVTLAPPPKDPVLAAAWQANGALFVAALVASLFTALYSARIFALVFLGAPSQPARQAREARKGLLVPLLVLAVLIPFGLLANATLLGQPLARLLGVPTPDGIVTTVLALAIAVIGVAAGIGARLVWPAEIAWPPLKPVTPLFAGEFGLQACYQLLTRLAFFIIQKLGAFDRLVFGTLTDGLVKVTLALVRASARFDVRRIDAAVRDLGQDILAFSQRVRALQTGRIENYLLAVFAWSLAVVAVAIMAAFIH